MLRRHLLFFVTGALLALAAVLIVRAGDDGSAAGSAGRPGSGSTSTLTVSPVPRSVQLRTHRRVLRGHRRAASSAPSSKVTGPATPPRATGGSARPSTGGAGTEPRPGTGTVPASTVPGDTTETVPGDGGQTTEPPAGTGTSTGAGTPPPEPSAGVTIPNPATPDASVNP